MKRRDFIRIMGGAGALFAFPGVMVQGCRRTIDRVRERTPVIWLQGQSCSGCSVSLLNAGSADIVSLLTGVISLTFHQTVSAATGHTAIDILRNILEKECRDYVLVVEGSIPLKSPVFNTLGEIDGKHRGIDEWVTLLGGNAKAVIAVGTCASYGCIPGAKLRTGGDNPTGAVPIWELLPGRTPINVPGCPPHPDWITGSLLQVLLNRRVKLDEYGRPLLYYKKTVHDQCEWLEDYNKGNFARRWGEKGCLYHLGCLGIDSNCDIPTRKWVGINTCTGCGSGCIGCTEPVFPDTGERGLYIQRKA